jgi:hypothetical protein
MLKSGPSWICTYYKDLWLFYKACTYIDIYDPSVSVICCSKPQFNNSTNWCLRSQYSRQVFEHGYSLWILCSITILPLHVHAGCSHHIPITISGVRHTAARNISRNVRDAFVLPTISQNIIYIIFSNYCLLGWALCSHSVAEGRNSGRAIVHLVTLRPSSN